MTATHRHFDGSRVAPSHEVIADPLRRLRWLLVGFIAISTAVLVRAAALEATSGGRFRGSTHQEQITVEPLPATRGRLLARDGSVLACDEAMLALAVNYRYLEDPPDPAWLRGMARARLQQRAAGGAAANIRDPILLAAEISRLRVELADLQRRLAALCGLPPAEWQARCRQIQCQVEGLTDRVNQRREAAFAHRTALADESENDSADRGWAAATERVLGELFAPPRELPPAKIDVREEHQEHIVARGLTLAAVAEIEGAPHQYPGTRIIRQFRRTYPQGPLAAHVIGYVASAGPNEVQGRSGAEAAAELWLHGAAGRTERRFDSRGRLISSTVAAGPRTGRDVILSIDTSLERTAEQLLDEFQAKRMSRVPGATPQKFSNLRDWGVAPATQVKTSPHPGGCIVVLDVRNGAVLAAAAAPRFDPRVFLGDQPGALKALLADADSPLLDRTAQMAIPPGSVFKTVTAIALLQSSAIDPEAKFECRGYLRQPSAQRCEIYRHYGVGHGPLTLDDALAQSCNVYFYHHAGQLGPEPLVAWAAALGFGRATGCDWCRDAAGQLPSPQAAREQGQPWRVADTENLAIGQGRLTVTPLQIVRMMAAVANGGKLVTPHVLVDVGLSNKNDVSDGDADGKFAEIQAAYTADPQPIIDPLPEHPVHPVPGLTAETLHHVRRGLERVVADPNGTGYTTVRLAGVTIAGKTGTAETGGGQADHAWFAGYAPADNPRVAFVVALEHAGNGGTAAGPLAKKLVEQLQREGYFDR